MFGREKVGGDCLSREKNKFGKLKGIEGKL